MRIDVIQQSLQIPFLGPQLAQAASLHDVNETWRWWVAVFHPIRQSRLQQQFGSHSIYSNAVCFLAGIGDNVGCFAL
ncbi:hypothetical protein ACOJBO_02960 [Rhizobium beringeri]